MNKKIFPYTIFVFAMICFIGLRLYAGHYFQTEGSVSYNEPEATSVPSNKSDSGSSDSSAMTVTSSQISVEKVAETSDSVAPEAVDTAGILNNPWHGDFTPVDKFSGKLPRIVCWGDSLTEATSTKSSYPDYLKSLTGCEVLNYGIHSEKTYMVAMREGGVPIYVKSTVIPSSCDMIPVFLESDFDNPLYLLDFGDAGINPCSIMGINGTLSKINGAYYFERLAEGERRSVDDNTPFSTFAMLDSSKDDVLVIYTGTNDFPDSESIYDIISLQRDMLKAANCSKYVIVGLTYSDRISDIEAVNEILANEYENNFLDIRSYMLSHGLDDANITPTPTDMTDIAEGRIPSSLRVDDIHGNRRFNELLAKQLYRRFQYLGYLPLEANQ